MSQLNVFNTSILIVALLLVTLKLEAQEKKVKNENYVFSTTDLVRYKFPTHINDLVMDRSEATFSEVFIVIIEPEKAPPLHVHNDTEQIFYVLEGKGTLTIGKDKQINQRVAPGDIIRIPVGAWHSIKADSDAVLKYLAIDCFGSIRNEDEPTWESHVKVLCKEQGWDFSKVRVK
ncbi:MAG: cupin domain-containing protein [Bacteroidales bacterium]|nr:cupin domain-containing protein [Bacteroidales bacterium]